MADNKKYYYLKLKDNFYDSEQLIILQNMQDGYLYSDILMKLYLRSLKTEGKLMFNNIIPYTPQVLAQVVRHQVGTVEKALKIFKELGLIEVLDNGVIYMLDIQNFIGKSSTDGDRKRLYRSKINEEKQAIGQMSDIRPPEIEIEIEKEIEIERDIEINTKKEKKNKYGFYKHVLLTPTQYEKLKEKYPNYEELITYLDNYIEMKGYKAKNHYLCFSSWVEDAVKEQKIKKERLGNQSERKTWRQTQNESIERAKRELLEEE